MKKSFLVVLCIVLSYTLIAQESNKQKEVSIVFSNLENFGLSYKTGTEQSLWRFNTLLASGGNLNSFADSVDTTNKSLSFTVKFGKEYRKFLADNFALRVGADLSFGFSKSTNHQDDLTVDEPDEIYDRTYYSPGLNLVFGFNYYWGDHFMVGAELLPSFTYRTGTITSKSSFMDYEEMTTDISQFYYGLNSNSLLLSLSYRF